MSGCAMQRVAIATVPAVRLPPVRDEDIAAQSSAPLLITGARGDARALARRIHDASFRRAAPCLQVWARDFPAGGPALEAACARLLDAASGGTMLIADIEEMEPGVQHVFFDLLAKVQEARLSLAARLATTTTMWLHDRVLAERFSERLFYRLNMIHLVVPNGDPGSKQ